MVLRGDPARAGHATVKALMPGPATRLLVVAPHPDDETLATGGLLQQAHAQGAAISVVLLTDGDNNPWPQRWLERRLLIDAAARQRWGERRRGEAQQALARLGLPDGVVYPLGWPDMGLTAKLLDDGEAMLATLTAHLRTFRPNLVILPALADRHPDHSAAHLLGMGAIRASGSDALCLEYLIHGLPAGAALRRVALSELQSQRKRDAVLAYVSQVSLSRKRLLRLVTPNEDFRVVGSDEPAEMVGSGLPWRLPRILRPCFEVLVHAGGHTQVLPVPVSGRMVDLPLLTAATAGPVYFKLRTRWRTPWIFDCWGWRRYPRG